MEEAEYKATYNELTQVPCVFEKALTNQKAVCDLARHFCLADREGYACSSSDCSLQCYRLLTQLREKAQFSLKLHKVAGKLPHNMEIRVQAGGLEGLTRLLGIDALSSVHHVIRSAMAEYGGIAAIPFSEIMQAITRFKVRKRHKR